MNLTEFLSRVEMVAKSTDGERLYNKAVHAIEKETKNNWWQVVREWYVQGACHVISRNGNYYIYQIDDDCTIYRTKKLKQLSLFAHEAE